MNIKTDITIHGSRQIFAQSPATLGAPLILRLTNDTNGQGNNITIFLQDQELVDRLVAAINGAVEHKCKPDPAHEEAHNAAAVYDYRGSER